jgi:hypothetical protein
VVLRLAIGESSRASDTTVLLRVETVVPGTKPEFELVVDIDANSRLDVRLENDQTLGSVGLRQTSGITSTASAGALQEEGLLPQPVHVVTLPPFALANVKDNVATRRWLLRALLDYFVASGEWAAGREMQDRIRSDSNYEPDLPWIGLGRELVVDALEERFGRPLLALRYTSSADAMARALREAIEQSL